MSSSPVVRRLWRYLLAAGLAAFLVHVVTGLSWWLSRRLSDEVRGLVDMTSETGLFSWLSVVTWALLAGACLGWAGVQRGWRWKLTGGLFLFLSLDDGCMLHERSGHLLHEATRSSGVYPWLFVLGPVFVVLGLFALLIVRGLYRYSRNPIYVGVLSVICGWILIFSSKDIGIYALVTFVVFQLMIRLYEEPHLRRVFGEQYEQYCREVNRWLPLPRCQKARC